MIEEFEELHEPGDGGSAGEHPRVSPEDIPDGDSVTLKKSALSRLGFFLKDFRFPLNGFPNRYWIEWGYNLNQMSEPEWIETVHPDDRDRVRRFVSSVMRSADGGVDCRYRVCDGKGSWYWVLSKGTVEFDETTGEPRRYIGVDFDITEIARLEEELREARAIAEAQALEAEALRSAGARITSSLSRREAAASVEEYLSDTIPIDRAVVFELVNRQLLPLNRGEEGCECYDGRGFLESDFGESALYAVLRRRAPDIVREPSRAGVFWLLVPMVHRNEVLGVIAAMRSDARQSTEREIRFATALADYMALALVNSRLYEEMSLLATTDHLSGLLTRHAFFTRADELLRNTGNTVLCGAIILDIDHFKRFNDTYGHLKGDEVIAGVARIFRENLRDDDLVARYGGEEFCALLPNTGTEGSRVVAERICEALRSARIAGIDRSVTASIGVASTADLAPDDRDVSALLDAADGALYRAKRDGRNRVYTAP